MSKTTTVNALPYPEDTDAPNGPAQIKALAELLDTLKYGSRNLKPTVEEKQQSEDMTLTESFVLVPGLKYEVTPAVASKLIVDLTVLPHPSTASNFIRWDIYKNGVAFLGAGKDFFYQLPTGATVGGYNPAHGTVILSLGAEATTIEVRARFEGGSNSELRKRGASMVTQLFAS